MSNSRGSWEGSAAAATGGGQHRRGHSTGSMAAATANKERDEDLALFHEMRARERNNFLHPNTDDIEASLTTKFGGISGYRITASPPRQHKGPNDLLGLEPEKNDYDWLLTPPGTPLFTSLEDAPVEVQIDVSSRASSRSRPSKIARGNSSPRRPSSPSSIGSVTSSLSRRPSLGNSSPSRPSTPGGGRPVTPTGRPSTPGRSSTPTTRRTLTTSASFNSTSSSRGTSSSNVRRTARSSSPSRKPRTVVVHPAMPGFPSEPPPNLRTSMPDRPTSNSRGASLSPRLGGNLKTSQNSDPGDVGGWNRRAVSPSFSRSYSNSSASSSKGSVISAHNSGVEVNRPSTPRINTDVTGKRPISAQEETSPVKPQSKKAVRMTGTGFSSVNSHRKSFDSSRQMDFRRTPTNGFRPLMSNSHISSFYTRASSSLQYRPTQSITDSSINSSSAASVHESDHDDEILSKQRERPRNLEVHDMESESILSTVDTRFLENGEVPSAWMPQSLDEHRDQVMHSMDEEIPEESGSPLLDADLGGDGYHGAAPMEIECIPSDKAYLEIVRSLLDVVIDEAIGVAEARNCQRQSQKVNLKTSDEKSRKQSCTSNIQPEQDVPRRIEVLKKGHEAANKEEEVGVLKGHEAANKEEEAGVLKGHEVAKEEVENKSSQVHCFSQLIDPKYSCCSMEVYQFDQELQSTCSPVVLGSPGRISNRDCSSPSTSVATLERKGSHSSSGDAVTRGDYPKVDAPTARSSRSCKPTLRDPPAAASFGPKQHSHVARKKESRESSLFSIPISSSKGESISSGRPASVDDTHSSVDTPRRFHDICNGDASSSSTYKAYDEDDTKSEASCVDYYIDSMEPKKYLNDKPLNRELDSLPPARYHIKEFTSPRLAVKEHEDCDIIAEKDSFDADEDGYVDYYIDDFSSQTKAARNRNSSSADLSICGEFLLEREMVPASHASNRDTIMETCFPEDTHDDRTVFMDDTHIEVCSVEESSSESGDPIPTAATDQIDMIAECWKQQEEAGFDMECEQQHGNGDLEQAQSDAVAVTRQLSRSRSSLSQHSVESSQGQKTAQASDNSTGNDLRTTYSLSATTDTILFCSSIVHDIVYRAATLGIEKEDLKALATPASAGELVTFLGLQQKGSFASLDGGTEEMKWKSEESTVRRTLTYMQNQKLMQNPTVAYMHSPVGRVQEDVKDHIIPEHHFIDRTLDKDEQVLERKAKTKCRCTIL